MINNADAAVGDLVTIEMNSKTVFKSAFFIYLVPAIGLLLGATSGNGLSSRLGIENPGLTIILSFAGLAAGLTSSALYSRWMSAKDNLTPIVTGIARHRH